MDTEALLIGERQILYSVLEQRAHEITKYLQKPGATRKAELLKQREIIYGLLQKLDGEA